MGQFKVGDEVILANLDPDHGRFGIPQSEFGKRFTIHQCGRHVGRNQYYIRGGTGMWSVVYESMLLPVTPPRSTGTPYRVVGPDWSGQLFVDPTAVTVLQIAADLADQCNLFESVTNDSTEDRIVLGDYTFLRV